MQNNNNKKKSNLFKQWRHYSMCGECFQDLLKDHIKTRFTNSTAISAVEFYHIFTPYDADYKNWNICQSIYIILILLAVVNIFLCNNATFMQFSTKKFSPINFLPKNSQESNGRLQGPSSGFEEWRRPGTVTIASPSPHT